MTVASNVTIEVTQVDVCNTTEAHNQQVCLGYDNLCRPAYVACDGLAPDDVTTPCYNVTDGNMGARRGLALKPSEPSRGLLLSPCEPLLRRPVLLRARAHIVTGANNELCNYQNLADYRTEYGSEMGCCRISGDVSPVPDPSAFDMPDKLSVSKKRWEGARAMMR